MSYGMLGELSLSEVQGPRDDLDQKLAGEDGRLWLTALNLFLRKENPWSNGAAHVRPEHHIIICPESFDPAKFVGAGWTIWRGPPDGNGLEGDEEQDAQSLALTEVDFEKALFETCLKERQTSITGEEKFKRLIAAKRICLDARFAVALYREPKQTTLRWLYKTKKITWMEFPGTTLRDPDGVRDWLYLYRYDGQWRWDYNWLVHDRDASDPAVVLAS